MAQMLLKIRAVVDDEEVADYDAPGPFVVISVNGQEYHASSLEVRRIAERLLLAADSALDKYLADQGVTC